MLIALNLGAEPIAVASDEIGLDGEILLSTFMDRVGERVGGTLDLRGDEGVIIGPRAGRGGVVVADFVISACAASSFRGRRGVSRA